MSFTIDNNFPVFIGRARLAEKLAKENGYWALDAILNSAIALEAFPNDFIRVLRPSYELERNRLPESLIAAYRILPEVETLAIQTKYQILVHLLNGTTFDPGKPPFQDFDFLIKLRNEIVHPKCEGIDNHSAKDPYEKVTKKMLAGIHSRNLSHIGREARLPWKRHIENAQSAEWAVATAKAMIVSICDVFPDSSLKRDWLLQITGENSSMKRPI